MNTADGMSTPTPTQGRVVTNDPSYSQTAGRLLRQGRVTMISEIPDNLRKVAQDAQRTMPPGARAEALFDNGEVLMFELVVTAGLLRRGMTSLALARLDAMRERLRTNAGTLVSHGDDL